MFSIGFWEVILILAVAVILVNPRELPKVLRTAGSVIGRIKSFQEDIRRVARDLDKYVDEYTDKTSEEGKPEKRSEREIESQVASEKESNE